MNCSTVAELFLRGRFIQPGGCLFLGGRFIQPVAVLPGQRIAVRLVVFVTGRV
jgi:hypothetical protein